MNPHQLSYPPELLASLEFVLFMQQSLDFYHIVQLNCKTGSEGKIRKASSMTVIRMHGKC